MARENADGGRRGTLTQEELAERVKQQDGTLKLNKRTIGEIERGNRNTTDRELLAISAVLKTSVDELLTGEQPKYVRLKETYGLGGKSIKTLEKLWKEKRYGISALDMILEDERLATALIDSLVLYAESQMLTISPLMEKNVENFIYVNSQTSDDIMKQVALQRLSRLLDCVRIKWELKYYPTVDVDLERKMRRAKRAGKKPAKELKERLRYKMKENIKGIQGYPVIAIGEYDEALEQFMVELSKKKRTQLEKEQIKLVRKIVEDTEE